jgi:hypothetical protein
LVVTARKDQKEKIYFTIHEGKCKSGSITPLIPNLVARWNKCLASRLGRFVQRGNNFRCLLKRGLVDPRAGLEVLKVRAKLLPLPGMQLLFWVFQPVSQSLYQTPYSGFFVNIRSIVLTKRVLQKVRSSAFSPFFFNSPSICRCCTMLKSVVIQTMRKHNNNNNANLNLRPLIA